MVKGNRTVVLFRAPEVKITEEVAFPYVGLFLFGAPHMTHRMGPIRRHGAKSKYLLILIRTALWGPSGVSYEAPQIETILKFAKSEKDVTPRTRHILRRDVH